LVVREQGKAGLGSCGDAYGGWKVAGILGTVAWQMTESDDVKSFVGVSRNTVHIIFDSIDYYIHGNFTPIPNNWCLGTYL